MPPGPGKKWSGVFEDRGGCWRWVVMAVTVSTVLGPRWMTSNRRKTVARINPDQTRPDHLRYQLRPLQGSERRYRPESAEESSLCFRVGLRFKTEGQARQVGGAMGEGSGGREAHARIVRGTDEQSRAEQVRAEQTREKVCEGKTKPSLLDDTPPVNLDYLSRLYGLR